MRKNNNNRNKQTRQNFYTNPNPVQVYNKFDVNAPVNPENKRFHVGPDICEDLLIDAIHLFQGFKCVIAYNCGMARGTLDRKLEKSEKLRTALEDAKIGCHEYVKSKLMMRIDGYNHVEEKVFCNNGDIVTHETIKHYPPDVKAMEIYVKWDSHKLGEIEDEDEEQITVVELPNDGRN